MEAWNVWLDMCVQADKLIRELQSNNRLLKSELQATTTSFKQALHVAQTMLDTGVHSPLLTPPPCPLPCPLAHLPPLHMMPQYTFSFAPSSICACSFMTLLAGLLSIPPTHPLARSHILPPTRPSMRLLLDHFLPPCLSGLPP